MLSEYVHYSDTRINRIISIDVISMKITLKLRQLLQVNVAVAGNMGSGKSTLIGVLSTGQYDNGKGSARTQVISMFISDDNDDDDDDDCTIIMYDIKILMFTIYDMMMLVELLETFSCYFLPFYPQHSLVYLTLQAPILPSTCFNRC